MKPFAYPSLQQRNENVTSIPHHCPHQIRHKTAEIITRDSGGLPPAIPYMQRLAGSSVIACINKALRPWPKIDTQYALMLKPS